MADVNWTKYNCDLCRSAGLVLAAIAASAIVGVLLALGLPIWVVGILFLVCWFILFQVVESQCMARMKAQFMSAAAPVTVTRAIAQPGSPKIETMVKAPEVAPVAAPGFAEASTPFVPAETGPAEAGSPEDGTRPEALSGARGGVADDLKRIKGIGPKLEQLCNTLGFYHFDQIANWSQAEIAWVDQNLEGFRGRVTRDDWVAQARTLAAGGDTEFSKRVDDGGVPSSQG